MDKPTQKQQRFKFPNKLYLMAAIVLFFFILFILMPMRTAAASTWSVTYSLEGMTSDGPDTINNGEMLNTKIAANKGFKLPDEGEVKVTMGGRELTRGSLSNGYLLMPADGGYVIGIMSVTGDVVITAVGVPLSSDATLSELGYDYCAAVGGYRGYSTNILDGENLTYDVELPYDICSKKVYVDHEKSDKNATIVADDHILLGPDGTGTASLTVTAEDGVTTKTYTINFTTAVDTRSDANEITTFMIPNQAAPTRIDQENHTISILMPFGTDLTSLKPSISFSSLATISPKNNVAQDFSSQVTYTVTAQNGQEQEYYVTVSTQGPPVEMIP